MIAQRKRIARLVFEQNVEADHAVVALIAIGDLDDGGYEWPGIKTESSTLG